MESESSKVIKEVQLCLSPGSVPSYYLKTGILINRQESGSQKGGMIQGWKSNPMITEYHYFILGTYSSKER